jgi:hypothetical protein
VQQLPSVSGLTWGADCPGTSVDFLPETIPTIWPYVTGTPDVIWLRQQIARFSASRVYRVNQGFESPSPFLGDEFDFEAGCFTLAQIVAIVRQRNSQRWSTRIYCTYANYAIVKETLANFGLGRNVWFRIADWNLSEHLAQLELYADVYAGQWASPTSNPMTLIPGTGHTLAQANVDLNVHLIEYTGWQS